MIRKIRGGGHPGILTQVQLEAVIRWIADGAPEGTYEPGLENWTQPAGSGGSSGTFHGMGKSIKADPGMDSRTKWSFGEIAPPEG
jgi:hypothetical protein